MKLSFQSVSVAFGATQILSDLTFTLHEGERLALIGESGAGKSSVVGLIVRQRDPCEGAVCINDIPLPHYNLASVLRAIGMIPQHGEIISGSVRENVLLSLHPDDLGSISDEDVWATLDRVGPDFRSRFKKDGLDTHVGKHGLQLSGGERQRLCVARALIKQPELLIVDEATASLDARSQSMVQKSIDTALDSGPSAIVIAHRLSTLRRCTRFMVLKKHRNGDTSSQIEADCTSLKELHSQSPTFRELAHHEGIQF